MEAAAPPFDPYSYQKSGRPLVVVLTGAGISAESGLKTFRDAGGLWENHDIMTVASIEGWYRNPELVLQFYNDRRQQAYAAQPNTGHIALAELEKEYDVIIITQNVDDLHEKAGSTRVVHLHGMLRLVRSTKNPYSVYDMGAAPIFLGDVCAEGGQLRPHIVWFGEEVPLILPCAYLTSMADAFLVVGTSLNVYPAAGLVDEAPDAIPKFIIDPKVPSWRHIPNMQALETSATEGVPQAIAWLRTHGFPVAS